MRQADLLDVEFGGAQQVHQWGQDAGLHHALDLLLGACRDIGDRPACLLHNPTNTAGERTVDANAAMRGLRRLKPQL